MNQRDDAALLVSNDPVGELSARADRPTLMGLAPLDGEAGGDAEASVAEPPEPPPAEQTRSSPETSTVRSMQLLAAEVESGEAQAAQEQALGKPMSSAPASAVSDEADPEWLDLSTRWMITPAAQVTPVDAHAPDLEDEVTEHVQWADHLAVQRLPRADQRSAAPPPPMAAMMQAQSPASWRRQTMSGYGTPQPMAAAMQPQAAAYRGHTALGVGGVPAMSEMMPPLVAESWRGPAVSGVGATQAVLGGMQSSAAEAWRGQAGAGARNVPAMADAMRPSANASWRGSAMPASGDMRAMSEALRPSAGGSWRRSAENASAWSMTESSAGQRSHAQYQPPDRYGRPERRSNDYPPFYAASSGGVNTRRLRHSPSTFEQWRRVADPWIETLIKCTLAVLLFHYSGLAVPVMAMFGYAPAPAAAKGDSAAPPAAPIAATLASPAVGSAPQPSVFAAPAAGSLTAPAAVSVNRASDELAGAARPLASEPPGTRHNAGKPFRQRPGAPTSYKRSPAVSPPTYDSTSRFAAPAAPPPQQPVPPAAIPPGVVMQPQAAPGAYVAAAAPLTAATVVSDDAAGEAFLRINSRPWSQVFVDGTHVGHTPKLDLRVRAGVHRIRLVNAELGVSKTIELRAAAGATVSHFEFLEE